MYIIYLIQMNNHNKTMLGKKSHTTHTLTHLLKVSNTNKTLAVYVTKVLDVFGLIMNPLLKALRSLSFSFFQKLDLFCIHGIVFSLEPARRHLYSFSCYLFIFKTHLCGITTLVPRRVQLFFGEIFIVEALLISDAATIELAELFLKLNQLMEQDFWAWTVVVFCVDLQNITNPWRKPVGPQPSMWMQPLVLKTIWICRCGPSGKSYCSSCEWCVCSCCLQHYKTRLFCIIPYTYLTLSFDLPAGKLWLSTPVVEKMVCGISCTVVKTKVHKCQPQLTSEMTANLGVHVDDETTTEAVNELNAEQDILLLNSL